jgi:CubicO group peptidase (beta-lactamase class C family)
MASHMSARELEGRLHALCEKHKVVGAVFGVYDGETIETAAYGSLNLDTGVACTTDSVFQIGSISKIFTATLLMQLLDEKRLELDDLVVSHLPEFALADRGAAQSITIRQLLNHTSGMDGDFFPADDPEGPSTKSYVRKMCLLTNLFQPGEGPVTYCNSGYVVAGRIVEKLTGRPWREAVMERICVPLGMTAAFADPKDALRYRCAIGHVSGSPDTDRVSPTRDPYLPLSAAAAGAALTMSAESLLLFAKAHLANDRHAARQILSARSVRRMREEKTSLPPFSRPGVTDWGLGWFLADTPDYQMAGHDGATLGQFAHLRIFPDKNVAFTLLTNSMSGDLWREIEAETMQSVLGILPVDDAPPREAFTFHAERYTGRYQNAAETFTIDAQSGGLRLRYTAALGALREFEAVLLPYRADVFELKAEGLPVDGSKVSFLFQDGEAKAQFVRMGIRMARQSQCHD